MDEPKRLTLKRQATLQLAALVVLLDRTGGSIEFTEEEYQAAKARRGGGTKMAVHFEILQERDVKSVRVILIRKNPVNAELTS